MIETGRFMLAGCMGEIDPGNPDSNIPYYLKVKEGAALPKNAVVEEGEFCVAMISAGFDPKTKEPTGSTVYYVKATENVKEQVQKNCEDFGRFLARHLHDMEQEYRLKGLDFWEEIKKNHAGV